MATQCKSHYSLQPSLIRFDGYRMGYLEDQVTLKNCFLPCKPMKCCMLNRGQSNFSRHGGVTVCHMGPAKFGSGESLGCGCSLCDLDATDHFYTIKPGWFLSSVCTYLGGRPCHQCKLQGQRTMPWILDPNLLSRSTAIKVCWHYSHWRSYETPSATNLHCIVKSNHNYFKQLLFIQLLWRYYFFKTS